MRFLAISGSARRASTNTALLHVLAELAPDGVQVDVFEGLATLPIFSPDLEGAEPPAAAAYLQLVAEADGLIISCPEYVRALPGGFKNAIDWLVSREMMIEKPVALLHASHRGDDALESLRIVLRTITTRFNETLFLRFHLISKTPEQIRALLLEDEPAGRLRAFLTEFREYVRGRG